MGGKGSGNRSRAPRAPGAGRPPVKFELREGEEVSVLVGDATGAWGPLGTATIEIQKGTALLKLPDGRAIRLIEVE